MQTLTINIEDSHLNQILNFLQQIPKEKVEVFIHKKIDISKDSNNQNETKEKNKKYKPWRIEEIW